jgi:hypothetical protein
MRKQVGSDWKNTPDIIYPVEQKESQLLGIHPLEVDLEHGSDNP